MQEKREQLSHVNPSENGMELSRESDDKIQELLSNFKSAQNGKNALIQDASITYEPVAAYSYTVGKADYKDLKQIHTVKKNNKTADVIYDAVYGFDLLRRRATVNYENKTQNRAKKNIALIGCSFVFGMGVNDHETIASHLQAETGPDYRVLNLGIISGGANDFLDDLVFKKRIKDLDENTEGVAVYFYFSIHRERTFCLNDCYRDEWRRKLYLSKSAWNITNDDEVNHLGTIESSRSPVENLMRKIFYNTEIGRISKGLYSADNKKYKQEYVKYLKAMKKLWEEKNFKFLVYAFDTAETPWTDEDLKILDEQNIDYIYFKRGKLFKEVSDKGIIFGDDHFNSIGNKFHALRVYEALKNKKLITP